MSGAALVALCLAAGAALAQGRPPLRPADIDAIARLEMLEDYRDFNTTDLSRFLAADHPEVRRRAALAIGRIANRAGFALLTARALDRDTAVAATEVFAAGQLKDSSHVAWFDSLLTDAHAAPTVAAEAAIALGKIKTAGAREALARYLASAKAGARTNAAIGEALLSIGRCTARGDLAPIERWAGSPDSEIRWRATWALFRPRDPAGIPELLTLARDKSGDVRLWAIRALAMPQADSAGRGAEAERAILAAIGDPDRRVRTEAVRAIGTYSDSAAVAALTAAKESPDWWISSSALEGLARLNPPPAPAGGRQGRGGARTRRPPAPPTRTLADYKAIVERWVVPDYNGASRPVARWETARGAFDIELYPGDAPLAVDDFVNTMAAGTIVGTAFTRVVPDFVVQEQAIPGGHRLRDEVNRHGLTRGNLAWASGGLDTGTPGYTLGNAVQPHNEGDFTALGRVIRGMDVVDQIRQGDKITAARMVAAR